MTSISIIGTGNMARILAARALDGGNAVEVISRDPARAADLASALGRGATAGEFGLAPVGEIVILAVPYASAAPLVSKYGDAFAGKVIVDISNPFNSGATGLVTPDGTPPRSRPPRPPRSVPASSRRSTPSLATS